MKTGALSTTKKSKKEQAEHIAAGQALVGFFMEYLHDWSKEQILELVNKNPGLCVPVGDKGYLVGRYQITKDNTMWCVQTIDGYDQRMFGDRTVAIIYCVYMGRNMMNQALELRLLDADIVKLKTDLDYYQHSYKSAQNKQDWFKVDLFTTRIKEAKVKLAYLQDHLRKTLWAAKYNKVWDRKP